MNHLVLTLKAGIRHLRDRVLFVMGLINGEQGRVARKREVDTREAVKDYYSDHFCNMFDSRYQISLEFVQINIETAVKSKRCSDARNHL
jgi:hypothetical protein